MVTDETKNLEAEKTNESKEEGITKGNRNRGTTPPAKEPSNEVVDVEMVDMEERHNFKVFQISLSDVLKPELSCQYKGRCKFKPKEFASIGNINIQVVKHEVVELLIKFMTEKIFNVFDLSEFDHLLGNGGYHTCSYRDASAAVS